MVPEARCDAGAAAEAGAGRGGGDHRAVVGRQSRPWPILWLQGHLFPRRAPARGAVRRPAPSSPPGRWSCDPPTGHTASHPCDPCCGDARVLRVQCREALPSASAFDMCVYANLSVNNSLEIKQKRLKERKGRTNSVKFTLVPLPGKETKPQATTSARGAPQ